MGCVCTKSPRDPNAPRPVKTSYPRNPAYEGRPPPPVGPCVVLPPGGQSGFGGRDGEMLVAGAVMGYGMGSLPGPEMYNPLSGDYHML